MKRAGWKRWRRTLLALVIVALPWPLFRLVETVLDQVWPLPVTMGQPPEASRTVLAADGTVLRITPTGDGVRCLPLPADRSGLWLPAAVVAGEDRRYADHHGVDLLALLRAAFGNLWACRRISGASTITMQVARIAEPRPRSLAAKCCEILRARQIERRFGKTKILTDYLNRAPWGRQMRGAETASRAYWGRAAADLDPAQAAALAALLPAPSRLPTQPVEWRRRRDRILRVLATDGQWDDAALAQALAAPLPEGLRPWPFLAPHACDLALAESRDEVLHLPLDLPLQRRLETAVQEHGVPTDGLAVVVLDRATAALLALIGSPDWSRVPANDALAWRGAGSTLKPILWQAAVDRRLIHPGSLLADVPGCFAGWTPANADGAYLGAIPADEALATSRNLPAVRLLADLGVAGFRRHLADLGLAADQACDLDAALGTSGASPLALARAYVRLAEHDGEVLTALRRFPLDPVCTGTTAAWKTGTSHGRRDAWCVAITATRVVMVWLGRRDGQADPSCIGVATARPLAARVVAVL